MVHMTDRMDELIEALVRARENGMYPGTAAMLVRDVWAAPWSNDQVSSVADTYRAWPRKIELAKLEAKAAT